MTKKIVIIAMVLLLALAVSAGAAPSSYPIGVESTTSGILTVTNPSSASISSYDKAHNISGYAANGAVVSVYTLGGGQYNLMRRNDSPISFTVGASGMFVQPVWLSWGRNDILVVAELGGEIQVARRTISVLSSDLFRLINGFKLYNR